MANLVPKRLYFMSNHATGQKYEKILLLALIPKDL